METILETKEVSKIYRKRAVVDRVSMQVQRGDIYGFIGENGAGKTTLMRMICGLAAPDGGSICCFGSTNPQQWSRHIGCTIETPALYPQMTAEENMEVQRLMLSLPEDGRGKKLLEKLGIGDTGKKKTGQFSLGMKQRLMLAIALLGQPEFLVLDEPTNGLDPVGIKEVRDILLELNRKKGITILVSSHILGELEKMANRYGVIREGEMVETFSAEELPARCKQGLTLYTQQQERAEAVIKKTVPEAVFVREGERILHVYGCTDGEQINRLLLAENIPLQGIFPEKEHLEDYFLQLMGGKKG